MIIGNTILKELKTIYYGPQDYEINESYSQGFYEGPSPRVYGDSIYLNHQDSHLLGVDLKANNNTVEVHASEFLISTGKYDSGICDFDEKSVKMLCDKYGFIKTDKFKNHFYTVIDSIKELDIKIKVGQMLTALMTLYLTEHHEYDIKTGLEDEYNCYYIQRNYTLGKIDIKTVRDYLKNHDWVFKIEDTDTGFEVETVFVDSTGTPLKISVYPSNHGVFLSSDHNYQELSKVKDIDNILATFYCEDCSYLGYNKIESKIEEKNELCYFEFLVFVMLIAENVPFFNEFIKNLK